MAPLLNMAKQDIDLDEDLAGDINLHRLRHLSVLRELMTTKLQQECDAHEKEMSKAWETIQSSSALFQKRKTNMFTTLARIEGEDRAREVFGANLEDVAPPTLRAIAAFFGCKSRSPDKSNNDLFLPTPTTSVTESMRKFETRESASAAGTLSLENSAGPISVGGNHDVPAKSGSANGAPSKFYAKRSRVQFDFGTPSKNKKAKPTSPGDRESTLIPTKKPDIDSWEVEGSEYIFRYPAFGPGYFVLRCDLGSISTPHTFTAHPFEGNLAVEHFNNCKTCKGHDTTRQYQPDDIVSLHGHRVRGENVNEEWVRAANTRLSADISKSATPKSKNRQSLEIVCRFGAPDLQYETTPRSTST
ncbi:hypothetical protein B0T24DRAFT_591432 [Lasiosphaeria ovina]|uniref:Uncharacterized protein n=1 Tax=Lasiosphaeria ovina TaxID=92902 RepID=A0AAE0KFG7_9PEZI|nr:hypothetical protein B0T24DRAFT_591432 [Lasiosphaeria ovina]